ncbi:hypothetical protein NIES2135_55180 [Leptolyngbya boryana NIES-2135]|jgi:hypothetical protein|uniref:Uncharacterized protein n=1 Tax=Leptolyngbya boryana NIES-2135 TaxID=1973484 RepID=A0A1Z4JPD7_LEPBY|nr:MULTISPECIES: hypothetical protein [Leptolyngbya]BAY58645.1 hypothetical protein NIES2135_55180 [Leptolyngbya boryana NIES-2135]MBD2371033.1 hypothetical protein [Leptolyngbya sp. FACHB-161]MBD2377227.1 hypothetical protein [Leptolyngbya sp. FACHB-238]MBD2401955.1 hypothetical protein [Leptolyngbya sp. FACHB-239]MBD2408473.1 hypothetical protein [Leptolyngbya sp. FACHB-402]
MESTQPRVGLSYRQHLSIAGAIWTFVGAGLLAMGLLFWFHLPYLGFLDAQHLGFGSLALSVGLIKGKFVLDRTANRVIERAETLQEPNPIKSVFQLFGGKTIALIATMMLFGLGLRIAGVSYEIRGLIYLAVGAALLWSCRRYWSAAFQGEIGE